MKKIITLTLITILLFGCGESKPSKPNKIEASVIIQQIVERKLRSPSTAEFEYGMARSIKQIDENTFKVNSYVDAQNAFGATVRTKFACTVKHIKEGWTLVSLDFGI